MLSKDNAETAQGNSQIEAGTETEAAQGPETGQAPTDQLNSLIASLQAELESANKRISELNKENASRRQQLKGYEKAENERKQAEMTAEERLAALQSEREADLLSLDSLNSQLEAANKALEANLQSQFNQLNVPDYIKDAIADKPAAEQLQYLAEKAEAFRRDFTGVDLDAGKGGKAPKVLSVEDFKGKSAEWINANWDKYVESQRK